MDASLLMDASHLITCLGRYSTSELRSMLGEPLIEQLASRYFERIAQDNSDSRTDTVDPNKLATAPEESPPDKVKRPLNAFMAFRSKFAVYVMPSNTNRLLNRLLFENLPTCPAESCFRLLDNTLESRSFQTSLDPDCQSLLICERRNG